MKMKNATVTLILTGFLLISWDAGLGNQAFAQGGSGGLTEEQRREMEQKYQERWQDSERESKETTGERLQKAEQHRRDAERRQREAEKRLQELQQQQGK